MDGLRVLWMTTRKELQVWWRDPKVFAASIFAPLVLLLAFNLIFGRGRAIAIAVTDLDHSPGSGRLVELVGTRPSQLGGTYFRVIPVGPAEGERRFRQGEVLAWLTVPGGFGASLDRRQEAAVHLAIDNYNSDFAKNVRLYLNEALVTLYDETYPELRIQIAEHHAAGVRITWIDSIGMGLAGLAIVLGGLFNGFNGLLSEYRAGTIKPLLLAPRPLRHIIAAKVIYAVLGAVASGLLILGALRLLTGLPVARGLAGFLAVAIPAAWAYANLGLIVGLWVRRYMPAAAISMVFGVTTWFLSGSLGSLKAYSTTIQSIAAWLPITHAQEGFRNLLLLGDWQAVAVAAAYLSVAVAVTLAGLVLSLRRKFLLE